MSSPNEDRPAPDANKRKGPPRSRPKKRAPQEGVLLVERLYRFVGLQPQWTGFLVALFLIFGLCAIEIATGRMSIIATALSTGDDRFLDTTGPDPFGFVYLIFHFLLVGYAPTAVVLITRAARRSTEGVAALIEPSERARARVKGIGNYPRAHARAAGLFGALIATVIPLLDVAVWRDRAFNPFDPSDMTPEIFGQRIFALIFGYFVGQLIYCATAEAWRFNRLAGDVQSSMLLERHTLKPFTRLGLANVLIVIILPAILLLFLFNASLAPIILAVCAIAALIALLGLFGPLMGIHGRVATAKRDQLDWVNEALAGERASLQNGKGARFIALMSYRTYVESVREWPLDGTTLSRLGLYLMIPLISWVGAALVERVVNSALG